MKPYKLERWKEKQKKKNPTKGKRMAQLREETKRIALADFKFHTEHGSTRWFQWQHFEQRTLDDDIQNKDGFRHELYWNLKDKGMNIQWSDLDIMFPLYQSCIRKMEENKRRADFMEKTYEPLQEDLFEI